MAEIELALASSVVAGQSRVTAAQLEAGLASGRYAITGAEASLVAGLGITTSSWVDSYADHVNAAWQTQIVTAWGISAGMPTRVRRIRHLAGSGWSAWADL